MNRNNTVSVIEVAATDDPNNSSTVNRSNHPGTENAPQLAPSANELQPVNRPVSTSSDTAKLFGCDDSSPVLLIDKIAFKLKMKEILICRVCTELRRCPMYQCKYGHLICAGCFNDILSESRLQNEIASCPYCQTTITKDLCFRNVAVEKTISELPITCPYCSVEFPPENFKYHENLLCRNRPSVCSNSVIGCPWQGPNFEKAQHEKDCTQPSASGYDILKSLTSLDQQQKEGMELYNKIMDLLSIEKISYTDLQLKHNKTENETKTEIFETSKFSAFDNQWVIRAACITDASKNISISYQLILKSKMIGPMNLQYIVLRGPYNDMDIRVKIHQFKFSDKAMESPYQTLDLPKTLDKEVFQLAKRINIRIMMFIISR